ncbi:hypothetical protein Cgig2_003327 [Carnegiea gigantea]|uniref:Uncharacterized protein n=1 Tax=Carnegiea gigantea TaxID=171969 RepID=A0A9Q1K169_9CARY|nr:hypothetical protein Cgig2_003327 [Carnegiea gigantea]
MQGEGNAKLEDRLTIKQLMLQNLDYGLSLYLTNVLTLSIFPGFLYENTGHHSLGEWYTLVLIAVNNISDLMGRYAPLISCLKLESRKGLMTAVVTRFLFIPTFYFTAKYADQGWMLMLTSLLGLTNGTRAECIGKFTRGAPHEWHIFGSMSWLVVDPWKPELLRMERAKCDEALKLMTAVTLMWEGHYL